MPRNSLPMKTMLAVLIASLAAANPAFSQHPPGQGGRKQEDERPETQGKGKGRDRDAVGRQDSSEHRGGKDRDREATRRAEPARPPGRANREPESPRRPGASNRHFEDRHRLIVHDYYAREYRAGRCPPGLAKKNNGCMPPGQARKWKTGQPIPRDVIFYDLPPTLVVQIGPPPPGYRFVRVAADILLIAIGTGIVIDAIMDLGNM